MAEKLGRPEEKAAEVRAPPEAHTASVAGTEVPPEKSAEGIIGKCMPIPPLKGLKDIEGYVVSEDLSAAIFKGKLKGGGIQIPRHIQKAFKGDKMILTVAVQDREKKER